MTRNLAFIALRLLELTVATLAPLFPTAAFAIVYALDPLHERLAPSRRFQLDDYAETLGRSAR